MAISAYTTPSDIRAALGVSSDELQDDTLSLNLYDQNLTVELEEISLNLPTDFATVSAVSSRSDTEERFYQATGLFATYAVARQLGTSLPLFSPKEVTDGKAAFSRFTANPYKDTLERIETEYGRARSRLALTYASYKGATTTTSTPVFMGVGSPTSDPVTGS